MLLSYGSEIPKFTRSESKNQLMAKSKRLAVSLQNLAVIFLPTSVS
jgi:hypothetical protein